MTNEPSDQIVHGVTIRPVPIGQVDLMSAFSEFRDQIDRMIRPAINAYEQEEWDNFRTYEHKTAAEKQLHKQLVIQRIEHRVGQLFQYLEQYFLVAMSAKSEEVTNTQPLLQLFRTNAEEIFKEIMPESGQKIPFQSILDAMPNIENGQART